MDPLQIPLKDIHLPAPISWWTPAPGWWLLLVVFLLAMGVWIWRRSSRERGPSHAGLRKEVLQQWQQLRAAQLDGQTDTRGLSELSEFLRRVALAVRPQAEVAALTGEAWLQYLDRFIGSNEFARGCGRLLIDAPYRPTRPIATADVRPCVDLCERWLHAALAEAAAKP
jgi:hypothetical protein